MPGRVNWHGDQWSRAFNAELKRRTSAASIRLASRVKADISQPGTLRYRPNPAKKRQRTIYNFTHSRPGNPPYKQTGHLRRSIAWEVVSGRSGTVVGRVGTNLKYGLYLEIGTRRMAARPYLRAALRKYRPEIVAILTKRFPAGGLGTIGSNQSRSGILGAGARAAGYH